MKPPTLCTHDATSIRIPPSLDGIRIGHLSDIHVRTGVRHHRLHLAVEMMNSLRPDFVVLTGDYVCLSPRPLPELTAALKKLNMPAYATLGNHDHWSDADQVRAALRAAGVDVLTNEHRVLRFGHQDLHLVGVDDSVTKHDDPQAAFEGVPANATKLVLSHDPKSADKLHAYNPALIFSGHTHGGQVFVKRLTPFVSRKIGIKYLAGFFEVNGALVYVTRGLGAGIPVRFRAPHEIACLTLRSAQTDRVARSA
ncbi:MAG: metallophosphoesterase [Myxococcaceae bacterium]